MEKKNRLKRKLDHIENTLKFPDGPNSPGFEDIYLIHQALPGIDWDEIDTSQNLWGKTLSFPLIINAITGGPVETEELNKKLSLLAAEYSIGMAVGSQTAALELSTSIPTFRIARKVNPNGLLLANVSANSPYHKALAAVDMIEADALQLHINTAQEIFMEEGDRRFSQLEENIAEIILKSPVPIIVKEVGFGISKECAHKLHSIGVKWVDVGGTGGTNFINIESARSDKSIITSLVSWGIPTAASLLEIKNENLPIKLIASGGIRNGLDLLKSIAMGAVSGAIAGSFIKAAVKPGTDEINQLLTAIKNDFRKGMLLSGCKNISELRNIPVIINGFIKEWIDTRSS
ncbi:MAG: hypothetical protein APF76_07480 [Desulfitibacter sp. BRH_c19]|nr:MAG: hypothetical protein APF76_07480 [Desulfitibacter sp. BRH_c19]